MNLVSREYRDLPATCLNKEQFSQRPIHLHRWAQREEWRRTRVEKVRMFVTRVPRHMTCLTLFHPSLLPFIILSLIFFSLIAVIWGKIISPIFISTDQREHAAPSLGTPALSALRFHLGLFWNTELHLLPLSLYPTSSTLSTALSVCTHTAGNQEILTLCARYGGHRPFSSVLFIFFLRFWKMIRIKQM